MYTLIPARLLSACVRRWRLQKQLGGKAQVSLSLGERRRVLCALMFLDPVNIQRGIFSIGTRGPGLGRRVPPPLTLHRGLLTRAVDIESSKHSLRDVLLGTRPKPQMEVTCGGSRRKAIHTTRPLSFLSPLHKFCEKHYTYTNNSYFVDRITEPYICFPLADLEIVYFRQGAATLQTTNTTESFIIVIAVIRPLFTFIQRAAGFFLQWNTYANIFGHCHYQPLNRHFIRDFLNARCKDKLPWIPRCLSTVY